MKNFLIVGLTGQTGAGKSTVAAHLRSRGIPVIDADKKARAAIDASVPCLEAIAAAFGREMLSGGVLDRKKLGTAVFADRAKLDTLNAIVHPVIVEELKRVLAGYKKEGEAVVIIDGATLIESGAVRLCGYVVSVVAPSFQRLERIMARDGLDEGAARNRISAQYAEEFYIAYSQLVIRNDGRREELLRKADALADSLLSGDIQYTQII